MKTKSRQGMTLVELIVATSLSAALLSAVMGTFIAIGKSSIRLAAYSDMEQSTSRGLEQLGRELRMTQSITTPSGSPITQVNLGIPNAAGTITPVEYRLNSATRTLVRTVGTTRTTLIGDIQAGSFGFLRYDLAGAAATNDFGTNQIQISMTIAPSTSGLVAATTKRVVSARFVLRNR
jgi:prepilin-type N-terminal cleavage/methylation domain-containing protein